MNKKRKLAILSLTLLFIALIVLIKIDMISWFDEPIYQFITKNITPNITNIFKVITFFGSTIFIIILSVICFLVFLIIKKKNCSFIVATVIIISTVLNNTIKLIIRRPRPEVLALAVENSFSFPSGHTMAAVSLYGILLFIALKSNLSKKIKTIISIPLFCLPILIGISRIYLGVHFASDVLGGIIMSVILLLISTNVIAQKKIL